VQSAMLSDPSIQFGNGNIFKKGYSEELDSYIEAKFSAKQWLEKFQEQERINTGISTLKVSFNSVFGYFIEITKIHNSKVPPHYERKQTLTNAERYTTPILKEFETKILDAEFKIQELEQHLFSGIKSKILEYIEQIQQNAFALAQLDCLQSFANVAKLNDYVKPKIDESLTLDIENGRHPVIEKMLPAGEKYTPNSTFLDCENDQIHIITGPNMAGKSCYLRQTALIILLGQIGSFVPARRANFGLVDRIFTRVGAQDNITSGESTFLVEMQETAYILNNATQRSLILLDEVGRGTATFDGISIAWSIAEHLHNFVGAKTLFATHYHELNDLAERFARIKNYRAEVIEKNNSIIFSHKISQGSSDHSFGIYVGKMAGLPSSVIDRAGEIMLDLERNSSSESEQKLFINTSTVAKKKQINSATVSNQLSIFEFRDDVLRDKIRSVDINAITPIQALQLLEELKNTVKFL
jgi:DNA mismatch repair protein MutS